MPTFRNLLFVCAISLGPALFVVAQTQLVAAQTEPAAAATEDDLDLVALSEFLAANQAQIEQWEKVSQTGIQNAVEAEQRFDEVIGLYENLISTVGSQSELAADFDAFIGLYEGYAEEAAASSNPAVRAMADSLLKVADDARALKIDYIQEAGRAVTLIDELRDEKEAAVFQFRINQGNLVNETYRQQLTLFRETNDRMQTALEAARDGGVPVTVTPVEQ